MHDLAVLTIHLIATVAKLLLPGGARSRSIQQFERLVSVEEGMRSMSCSSTYDDASLHPAAEIPPDAACRLDQPSPA